MACVTYRHLGCYWKIEPKWFLKDPTFCESVKRENPYKIFNQVNIIFVAHSKPLARSFNPCINSFIFCFRLIYYIIVIIIITILVYREVTSDEWRENILNVRESFVSFHFIHQLLKTTTTHGRKNCYHSFYIFCYFDFIIHSI